MGIEFHPDPGEIARLFGLSEAPITFERYGSGHINDTFLATYVSPGGITRVIHQRINTLVFVRPEEMMDNIVRVTEHIGRGGGPDSGTSIPELGVPRVVPATDGRPFAYDLEGGFWRSLTFVVGARSFDRVQSPAQAREAGRAFGHFQLLLSDLPGPRLFDTIPRFHDGGMRFEAFEKVLAADPAGRVPACGPEIAFLSAREGVLRQPLQWLHEGRLPERITHNDTKINNLLFDVASDRAVCVLDLDTVMPGLAGYDFGDLARTATSPTDEDETDLEKVEVDAALYRALAEGFLEGASHLKAFERETLFDFGKMITLMIGCRFLTDHLNGDQYFRIHREGQNLDRARVQFKLVASMEAQERVLR
ncbi:MAG: aminoglycoside phosphotransferase family protein [Armatimonadetes bacterium]|nr:aminoglycoside phosphotransferase family protein [Armatimonadota bacterium]